MQLPINGLNITILNINILKEEMPYYYNMIKIMLDL